MRNMVYVIVVYSFFYLVRMCGFFVFSIVLGIGIIRVKKIV